MLKIFKKISDLSVRYFCFFESVDEQLKDYNYDILNRMDLTSKQRRIKAFAVAVDYFSELFLVLTNYADQYYEKYSHKVNIKLEKKVFDKNIPEHYIEFKSIPDRRMVLVSLKSYDPTCHKIAVMFIKIFENRLPKYGADFDELALKIFYIRPKVEKSDKYQLEDYNFEAYIPNLLPLLIGENLYKQKEVFVRELIQNSIDAILLRKAIDSDNSNFDDKIKIHFGTKKRSLVLGSEQKEATNLIEIKDAGVGMTSAQVERYFIHIARSYYSSQEYEELIDKQKIDYKPISKFGIGFLSSFLYAKEIDVRTKSFMPSYAGVNIYIPNHEGCFFSKNDPGITEIGTTITLFENSNANISKKNIHSYIAKTFLDIQLDIEISTQDEKGKMSQYKLDKFKWRRALKEQNTPVFFVPLNDGGIIERKYNDIVLYDNEPFGIYFIFSKKVRYWNNFKGNYMELNGGILLNTGSDEKLRFNNYFMDICINYPPSYVQLDVSREKINEFQKFKEKRQTFIDLKPQIINSLIDQVSCWIEQEKKELFTLNLIEYYKIFRFMKLNGNADLQVAKSFYCVRLKVNNKSIGIEIIDPQNSQIKERNIIIPSPFDISRALIEKKELFYEIFTNGILENEQEIRTIFKLNNTKTDIITQIKEGKLKSNDIYDLERLKNWIDNYFEETFIEPDAEQHYKIFRDIDKAINRIAKGQKNPTKVISSLFWKFVVMWSIYAYETFNTPLRTVKVGQSAKNFSIDKTIKELLNLIKEE